MVGEGLDNLEKANDAYRNMIISKEGDFSAKILCLKRFTFNVSHEERPVSRYEKKKMAGKMRLRFGTERIDK